MKRTNLRLLLPPWPRTKTIQRPASRNGPAASAGETKEYAVPEGFKFEVDGKQVSAMELKRGMKISAIRIVEQPDKMIMQNIVVTGTAPK